MTQIESRSTPHIDVADRWHRLTPHSDATASRFIYLDSSRLLVSFNDIPTARRIRLITYAASFGVSRRTFNADVKVTHRLISHSDATSSPSYT